MKKIALLLVLTALAGCATWEGFESDISSGAGAVEGAVSN